MESKFRIGDKATLINHSRRKFTGKTVEIEDVRKHQIVGPSGWEEAYTYRISLNRKSMGWYSEKDLEPLIKK